MKFTDIKSMTFVKNNVSIDSRDIKISIPLDEKISAVQFHNGRDFCIEEPLMKEVPLTKYQFVLDEFEKQRDVLDAPPIEKEKTEKEILEEKYQAIEDFIYSEYTQTKQAQDAGWVANFTTKLVAGGVENLDEQIVNFTFLFYEGKTLEEILININDAVKPMYEKLVKVAVKNEWAYNCIQAGKKAITDNTEAVYPAFPVFE